MACYGKSRLSVCKSDYVSTENMLQDFQGICRYTTSEKITGIEFERQNLLLANIRPYLKKVWFADFSGAASTDVLVLKATTIVPGFLKYIIANESFISHVMSAVKGSKMPRGDKSHILNYTLGMPCHDEQQKIADFLSLVDERIEKQRQLVEVLKRYKRGYFQQIILGLDTKDFEVADVVKEYTEKTQTQNEYPILSSTLSGIQLQNSYFNKQAASENTVGYKIVPYGYFTYRSMSDTGDFRFNLQTIIDKGIVSPAYPVFSILDDHESEFVEYILNETDKIKNQLHIIKEGGTRYALSFAKFKSLTISLPTKQQQENFVNQLRLFNKLLSREETIYIDLQKHKSALLQQMFI